MVTAVVGGAILVLVLAFIVVLARDPGPPSDDVALAYELAWDHFDFEALWTLSGDELHDGLARPEFVLAKQQAYAHQRGLGRLAREVLVEEADERESTSVVHTLVELRDGATVHNEVQLRKRAGRWVVVGYQLRTDTSSPG